MSEKFAQLIHGKLVIRHDNGYLDHGYQWVGLNSEYIEKDNLLNYHFWGSIPPQINRKSVGLVWHENQPILIQVNTMIDPQTNQPLVIGSRRVDQHRYVFLTSEFLNQIQGKIYHLLTWLYEQDIPLFSTVNENLDLLEVPDFREKPDNIEQVANFFHQSNRSIIFEYLDSLFTGKRILHTQETSLNPNDFLVTLLLLLPLIIRCQISLAVGTIDENNCDWAQLMIKLNKFSSGCLNLPDNVVWLNQNYLKQSEESSFESNYVNLLELITKNSDNFPELLSQLNQMNSEKITLSNPIHPQAIIPLLQFLPNEKQAEYLEPYLSSIINDELLRETITLARDNQQLLLYIAKELIKQSQDKFTSKFIYIWQLTTQPSAILKLVDPVSDFTIALLKQGFLNYHLEELTEELTNLCIKVIANIKQPYKKWEVACDLELFFISKYPQKYFKILDSVFPESILITPELAQDVNYPEQIIDLIPQLAEAEQDYYWDKYLSNLKYNQWENIFDLINEKAIKFAWKYLSNLINNDFPNEKNYANLMVKLWAKMTEEQQVNILDSQLINDLILAEKLIKYKFHSQFQTEVIAEKLRLLCQNIVESKAKTDANLAWNFACNLLSDSQALFPDNEAQFNLLDCSFIGGFRQEDFPQIFYLKIVEFLPQLHTQKILDSKFYLQLQKQNYPAGNLLQQLFSNKNQDLQLLPHFAIFMKMNEEQQDKFYFEILINWQPNYDQAKNLLIALLELNQKQQLKFNSNTYGKVCSWFVSLKPELKTIFEQFSQDNLNWQIWYNLANILEQDQLQALRFLDRLLGESLLKIEILKKWLFLIEQNSETIENLTQTSVAWKNLQENELNQLLKTNPNDAEKLTFCLQQSQRLKWLRGSILHYLGQIWINKKEIDSQLKALITAPDIIQQYSIDDCLKLTQIKWKLMAVFVEQTENDLINWLNKPLLSDEKKSNLTIYAQEIVKDYINPQQLTILFQDCENWGLSLNQRKKIIKVASPSTYSISLLSDYDLLNLREVCIILKDYPDIQIKLEQAIIQYFSSF